jgi:hypothetical protein
MCHTTTLKKKPSNSNPIKGNPPHQGPPPPHQPRTTCKPLSHQVTKVPNYLDVCCFQIHVIFFLSHLQRKFLSPQALRRASAEWPLILTNLTTLTYVALAHIMRSSQTRSSILDSCHCSWWNTLSLRSTQIVQRIMPQRRCQFLIF